MRPRVLITRSAERSAELISALRAADISVIAEPVTSTLFIADVKALPKLSRVNWIAFTSVNAVNAFADLLSDSDQALPRDVRLAAVGPATAQQVSNRLRAPDLTCAAATGAELGQVILQNANNDNELTVLWPCAQESLPDFSTALTTAGAIVIEWPVYATQPVAPWQLHMRLERSSSFDIVVFAAPSAVISLREAWPEPWPFIPVAIGQTTAAAIRKAGLAEPLVAASARTTDVLSTILDALHLDFTGTAIDPAITNLSEGR
jgi:uroporphyrinogen-III synthase